MSESLLRLRVDSQEYDANIRKAAEGIQYLAKRIHDTQGVAPHVGAWIETL